MELRWPTSRDFLPALEQLRALRSQDFSVGDPCSDDKGAQGPGSDGERFSYEPGHRRPRPTSATCREHHPRDVQLGGSRRSRGRPSGVRPLIRGTSARSGRMRAAYRRPGHLEPLARRSRRSRRRLHRQAGKKCRPSERIGLPARQRAQTNGHGARMVGGGSGPGMERARLSTAPVCAAVALALDGRADPDGACCSTLRWARVASDWR
jgi:hypothetical protein